MESKKQSKLEDGEFSLKELLEVLWSGRWLILFVTILSTAAAGAIAWNLPKIYQASIVISPASESSGSQLSGMNSGAGQFSGLASLAGLTMGGDSKKAESLAVLQSEALTEKYIKENDLLPVLFASKWDAPASRWKVQDPSKVPTLWKANELFRDKIRTVVINPKTSLVTMSISWRDPHVAAKWANDLVKVTNDYLRGKAIEQSERNIAYLSQEAVKTDVVGVRQAIYSILQAEISKVMLARGSDEYAFKVLDMAIAPERATAPRKVLWLMGGCVAGLALSILLVLFRVTRIV